MERCTTHGIPCEGVFSSWVPFLKGHVGAMHAPDAFLQAYVCRVGTRAAALAGVEPAGMAVPGTAATNDAGGAMDDERAGGAAAGGGESLLRGASSMSEQPEGPLLSRDASGITATDTGEAPASSAAQRCCLRRRVLWHCAGP